MYVEIGPYKVERGEILPTKDLINDFRYKFYPLTTLPMRYYTIIMVDLDAPYPENPINSPYLHYLSVNNNFSQERVIVDYIPPSPPKDSEPHRYVVFIFRQVKPMPIPTIETRVNFDVEDFLQYEFENGRPLTLIDRVEFIGDPRIGMEYAGKQIDDLINKKSFSSKSPEDPDFFSEVYDIDKLSEEDMQVLADIYNIPDAYELSKSQIKAKINKILSYS